MKGENLMLKKMVIIVLIVTLSLIFLSPSAARAQNLIGNGDFSAGLQGWTVVPTGETAPWPLVNGAANLHPIVNSGYTGTVIYQDLSITGAAGKTYSLSMKLLKTGMPDGTWRTIAVYLTYTDNGSPVRYKLVNPLNSEIATPVSMEGIPTFSGAITASLTLPATATAITKIEIVKENSGDFTVDDIVLSEGAASPTCTFTFAKNGSPFQGGIFLEPAAGAATLNVTASASTCGWNASVASGSEWLTITSGETGTGNGTIQISAAANPSTTGSPRSASISLVSGQHISIMQLATALPRSVVSLGNLKSQRAGGHTATNLLNGTSPVNGKILIVGGFTSVNTTEVLATAELYDPATRTFTLTGSLNVPRWGHTATLLSDGKVLIAGGYNYQGSAHTNLDTAEIYDPATGQFILLTSKMSSPRRQHTATAFPDPNDKKVMKILIAGGINSGGAAQTDTWTVTNTADIYDVATATFTPTGDLITGRGTHRATVIPKSYVTLPTGGTAISSYNILIAAGSSFSSYLAGAEIYDPATGTFTATGSMATGRAHGIGSFSNVFGGGITTGQTCLTSTEVYNLGTGTFSAYATLNQARRGHEVTQLSSGSILVSGGDCAGNPTMEILNLATDTFTNTSTNMTTARVFHTATPLYGNSPEFDILIVGGNPAGTAELYTSATSGTFTLTVQKDGTGTGTVSGTGLVCGAAGCQGSYPAGIQVVLTASPAAGSTFTGWSGCLGTGACTVTMDAAKTVTATFASSSPPPDASTLPRTGQTTCYDAAGTTITCTGTAQDGGILAGTAWPSPRFTDNGNGTITDNLTGLVWLKDAGCTGFGPFVPWTDALTKANALATGECGLSDGSQAGDWRMPNINELRSILNAGQAATSAWLMTQGFLNVRNSTYWSSTGYVSNYAWTVNMENGEMNGLGVTPGTALWPVRTGQTAGSISLPKTGQTIKIANGDDGDLKKGLSWPSPRFTDNGNGTVKDNLTGLVWLKNATCSLLKDWNDALVFAAGMASGQCGLTDGSQAGNWRLPNTNELLSLIDRSRLNPALPEGHPFTNVVSNAYWTSTSQAHLTSSAWQINLANGVGYGANKADWRYTADVWPVRTGQSSGGGSLLLTVAKAGAGSGTVTGAPSGIDCGSTCSASFNAGTQVTLTAAAASGSTFTGWSGGGCSGPGACTVTLNNDTAITATFLITVETHAGTGPDMVVFDRAVLDGSVSQGNIVSYQWTLTHRTNTAYSRTATGQKPDLTDLKPGFYDVTLTVTDAASQTKTATSLLAVAGLWDMSGDGKQGLAEVIYILQRMTGLRP